MDSCLEASSPLNLSIPEYNLGSGSSRIPLLGFGTASSPPVKSQVTKTAILQAIQLGYRHFDTASLYGTEQPLGEAIVEAIAAGLIKSRDELFITSKLWCTDAHGDLVLPALQRSLENLKLEYLDLYLIHWPVSSTPGIYGFPIKQEDFLPMDFKSVWKGMEDCQRLGLTKSIGVSNFSCTKLAHILSFADIPPTVSQGGIEPIVATKEAKRVLQGKWYLVTAYAPLGANGTIWGSNRVLECEVLKEIAKEKGKTVGQICLRWAYEQGISILVKSFNKDRMKSNLQIFNWSLSQDEVRKINDIPQTRLCTGHRFVSKYGPFKTIDEIWDGEI